jgi:hypothetical protein
MAGEHAQACVSAGWALSFSSFFFAARTVPDIHGSDTQEASPRQKGWPQSRNRRINPRWKWSTSKVLHLRPRCRECSSRKTWSWLCHRHMLQIWNVKGSTMHRVLTQKLCEYQHLQRTYKRRTGQCIDVPSIRSLECPMDCL